MLNWLSRIWRTGVGASKGAASQGIVRVPVPHISAVAEHNNLIWPNFADAAAQQQVYSSSAWVYVAVNRIAEAGALVPLQVHRLEGERRVAVENHPLERLLDAPNPFMSRFELFEATLGYLELTGNAYWYLAGDAAGRPMQIWPLRPDRVRIVPDEKRFIAGYVVEIDGQQIPLDAVEVVHFKRWHPGNDYYGLSTLQAARNAVVTDRAMAEWNRSTFGRDHAVPAGILNIKDFISQADFDRLKQEWRSTYGSGQRKTAFLRGGEAEWQSIGLNHNDLDFLKGRQANRDEILNLFGVPVGLVSENATEANAKVAERAFIERTLWPKLVRIAGKITQELLPFWPGEHVATFADIRPTDTRARLDEIKTAYPILSINEIRARYFQLDPVAWGDQPAQGSAELFAGKNNPAAAANETIRRDSILAVRHDTPTKSDATSLPFPETSGKGLGDGVYAELARWERFAIKRLNRPNSRPFSPDILSDELAFEINTALQHAHTEADIHALFADVRQRLETEAAEST